MSPEDIIDSESVGDEVQPSESLEPTVYETPVISILPISVVTRGGTGPESDFAGQPTSFGG